MNIYLVGFMGSGKTTVAGILAERLGWELIDTDNYIEKKSDMVIKDIFAAEGEETFRDMETEALVELSLTEHKVISCGGGIVLRRDNTDLMRQGGRIVLLNATPQTIYERVRHGTDRPVLNGNMTVEYITELMEKRSAYYEYAADIVVNTDGRTAEAIADEIMQKYKA